MAFPPSTRESSQLERKEAPTTAVNDVTTRGRVLRKTHAQTGRWRTEVEQQIYSSKLVNALRRLPRGASTSLGSPTAGRKVRETADRILAAVAKGRTRWSRAILTNRFGRKLLRKRKATWKPSRKEEITQKRRRSLPAIQSKVRVLGQLVPGGRKLPFPYLLEETMDYIAALEMQVRAMTALAEHISAPPSHRPDLSS